MPNFGLSRPIIAKLNVQTGKYSDAFKCGKAINTSITPNYNKASLYADNAQQEEVSEFKNAAVELGVDTLPVKAATIMFGHKIDKDGVEINNTNDSGEYVGYGFITAEKVSGVTRYRACLLTKVKFEEGAESYQTKGDSITFQTPTLSGTAMGNNENEWRYKSPYLDTEQECDEWILKKMGIEEAAEGTGVESENE